MASKTSNTNIHPAVVVASSSTSKESSPTTNDKSSKKSKHSSKSNSKDREEKSRKHKKKQHKSKKNQNEKDGIINDAPPLPPSNETAPPPPPPPSNLYDDIDEKSTTNNSVIKTNLLLSHSPPPVMPTILRQGSRSRFTTKEQLVPSSVIRTTTNQINDGNENNKHSPTSTTNTNQTEDLATKNFEEQLALLDATSSKLKMNNWDQSSGGSEEDEQIERICRMNNTGSISGPIQFKFHRTQQLPLKTSPVSNDVANNEEETVPIMVSTKKKRLHKPNDPADSPHSPLSSDDNDKNALQTKKQKTTENKSTESTTTSEQLTVPITTDEDAKLEVNKTEAVVASTTTEKKLDEEKNGDDRHHDSRSTSAASSRHRKRTSHRRHRRHRRRHSSSSTSRSSYTSTSSDSSRSSSSRSHRRRRRRRSRSSRSSSRSSSSSSDNRSRHSSRRSSRSYSRRRSSSSRSSRSSTSSRSSRSRSRSRSHNRKASRRSNNSRQQQSNNNGKGRGGGTRRGRGARNGPRGRRAPSNENLRRSSPADRNANKFNSKLGGGNGGGIRKLPNNKQPRVLIAATPKPTNNTENLDETAATSTTPIENDEIKTETIILTTNQNQQRPTAQKKNVKGKNKQQTPAYSLKKGDSEDMDQGDGESIIGPKLPPEFEKKINKDHSFTPPDMDDPENMEMLNDLKYRAEIHAAKNHGLITEMQAQQLIEERETQKQLADFPLIQMPMMSSPAISSMPSFIVAAPSPVIANYHHLQVASTATPQITTNPDTSSITFEQQQQQQQGQQQLQQQQSQTSMSPNSAASSNGETCSTPGQTTPNGTTTLLTQDGQQMMFQTATNTNPQLVQIAQPSQPMYMSMQAAVQQPRVVAIRTPQGGLQHFIEYPTAQLLQAQQQQQQQPQFIQHNGQLVQVIRPPVAYQTQTLMQQLQLQQQQQQQQVFAAQLQAQQFAAMQQTGGAVFLQNSAGQLVLAQQNPQAMRVVQIPYVPK